MSAALLTRGRRSYQAYGVKTALSTPYYAVLYKVSVFRGFCIPWPQFTGKSIFYVRKEG